LKYFIELKRKPINVVTLGPKETDKI
jgi:hypothetical protein